MEAIQNTFSGMESMILNLQGEAFGTHIIGSPELGSDIYRPGQHDDMTIKTMLDLCSFKHPEMTKASLSLLLRNMSQRVALFNALKDVQILVYPAAAKVHQETTFIIKRLSALHKHVAADNAAAYAEADALMKRLLSYLTPSVANIKEIVLKNQTILLNLGIDQPVRNLLGLALTRDTSRRDRGELEADTAMNIPRRDLFQTCYTLLKALVENSAKGQARYSEIMFL